MNIFTIDGNILLRFLYGTIFLAVVFMYVFNRRMMKEKTGDKKMKHLSGLIQKCAMQFLRTEYLYVSIFVVAVAIILALLPILTGNTNFEGTLTAFWFVVGALSSGFAGYFGMNRAVRANVRATNAAKRSMGESLKVSFSAGATVGIFLVTIGLVGLIIISKLYLLNEHRLEQALIGYAFGVASIALFARVGGGIFTKAADVGADLVGKVEAGIPEDDPRNPAVIADNVGDNVGDTAGMGADLYDSLIVNSVAAMTIGLAASSTANHGAFFFPLFVVAAGILASIVGTFFTRTSTEEPSKALTNGFVTTCIVLVGLVAFMNPFFFDNWNIFYTVVIGVVAGIFLGKITEFYTSYDYKHVKGIAESSTTGAATNIIHGLSVGMRSTFGIVATLMIAIYLSFMIAGVYGVAMAGVGMLSLAAIIMAIDVYGPIVDNAGGLAEMAALSKKVRDRTDKLDAAGNTTAAIGKGFAIGSAALAALALLQLFVRDAELAGIDLLGDGTNVLIGLFIGALVPYIFSSYVMMAVGKAAGEIVKEVRHQFKTIKGIMKGTAEPKYERCITIATRSALREMIMPSLLVIGTPIFVGLVLGPEALGGALGGTLVSGILLGIQQSNSGGAWDNAKKYVEKGNLGGKGSEVHKATVVGDTVGDPYKDSSGPSLNILIKLTILVATVFVAFF